MFRLEHSIYLILLILLPLLGLAFRFLKNKQEKEWRAFAQNDLWKKFSYGQQNFLKWGSFSLAAIIGLFSILALTNPQYTGRVEEVDIESTDVFIALDISRSMLANDLKPNRLTRAKNLGQDIIESLEGNRVGLILFAGEAYMFMPLTSDISAAISFLQSANVNMAPSQGTAIGAAINLSMTSFDIENEAAKAIVIISDGEDHEAEIVEAAKAAEDQNVFVFTVAVGTDAGAYLPGVGSDNYLFDELGKPVKSVVNEAMLSEISQITGASSFNLSKEKNINQAIANNINQMEKQVSEVTKFNSYDSYYQYLLFPVILLFLWQLLAPFLGSRRVKETTKTETS